MMDCIKQQQRIRRWVVDRFGEAMMRNRMERGLRHIEESLEMAQCCGVSSYDAMIVLLRVFNRPVGEVRQEMGASLVTLLAAAESFGFNAGELLEREIVRIENKPAAESRASHAEKAALGIGAPLENLSSEKCGFDVGISDATGFAD